MTALEMTQKEYKNAKINLIRAKKQNPDSAEAKNLEAKMKIKLHIIHLLEKEGDLNELD